MIFSALLRYNASVGILNKSTRWLRNTFTFNGLKTKLKKSSLVSSLFKTSLNAFRLKRSPTVKKTRTRVPNVKAMPSLILKSQQKLMEDWWSQRPFETDSLTMKVPIFRFKSFSYLQKDIQLPVQIFNCPLRRDLLYRLHNYRLNLDKFRTKKTRNRAETAGSGIKMRPQKGSGRARMGDKRAPHLRKGGKAHGAKPKVYSYHLNHKIKLTALKTLLTAKLVEGKIRIIDSERIEEGRTKLLYTTIMKHAKDERALFCILTSENHCKHFQRAQQNIRRIIWHNSYNLDVMTLFRADKILITQQGLKQLIENIRKTEYMLYKQPHMPSLEKETQEEQVQWDPQNPYQFKFSVLAEYMDRYKALKEQKPQLLEAEYKRIRPV